MKIVVANFKGGVGKSTLVLALADILPNSQVVDIDPQGTLKIGSALTKRHTPVSPGEAIGEYIIFDTPPYHGTQTKNHFESADWVIIPTKVSFTDLVATKTIVDDLRDLKMTHKGVIVFNEVRKPHNKTYEEAKLLFQSNFQEIRKAKTELSNLVSFSRILSEKISGQALEEMKQLVEELNIYKYVH